MNIHREDTAVVFIDPQNEVLSEKGSAWPLLHESLAENRTIENMERIFKAAKALSYEEASMLQSFEADRSLARACARTINIR